MKNGTFTVIPQSMVEYQMSIRAAELENDLFRTAFNEACKEDKPADPREELFAWDFFRYGWEAAVRLLNDDTERATAGNAATSEASSTYCGAAASTAATAAPGDLAPLPEPDCHTGDEAFGDAVSSFSSAAMREYGRACIASSAGAAPGVPEGWKLVPVEPTEDMVVRGFESKPDPFFSEPGVWAEYDEMTGCQKAAHRAKLCWAAMLAAAPSDTSPVGAKENKHA